MSYHMVKSWDNRRETKAKRSQTIKGRTWTRRCRWLEEDGQPIKLKFEEDDRYFEAGIPVSFAQIVWDRFKSGQSIENAISIYQVKVKPSRKYDI